MLANAARFLKSDQSSPSCNCFGPRPFHLGCVFDKFSSRCLVFANFLSDVGQVVCQESSKSHFELLESGVANFEAAVRNPQGDVGISSGHESFFRCGGMDRNDFL